MRRKQTIKKWKLELGIKVRNLKGFKGKKSSIKSKEYTREAFKIGIQKSEISVKTEKGLKFIEGQDIRDDYWKSYIEICETKKKGNSNYGRNFNKKKF